METLDLFNKAKQVTVLVECLQHGDGDTHVGETQNGTRHGQGTFTCSNGYKCVGEWKDGKRWKGTQCDKDGNVIATYSEGAGKRVN